MLQGLAARGQALDARSLSNIRPLPYAVRVILPGGGSVLALQAGEVTLKGWAGCVLTEFTIHNVLLIKGAHCDRVLSLPQLVTTGYTYREEQIGLHLNAESNTVFTFWNWVGDNVATSKRSQTFPLTPPPAAPMSAAALCPTGETAATAAPLSAGKCDHVRPCTQVGQVQQHSCVGTGELGSEGGKPGTAASCEGLLCVTIHEQVLQCGRERPRFPPPRQEVMSADQCTHSADDHGAEEAVMTVLGPCPGSAVAERAGRELRSVSPHQSDVRRSHSGGLPTLKAEIGEPPKRAPGVCNVPVT